MKKVLLFLSIFASTSVFAQHHHHGYHRHYVPNWGWVAPAIIGGAIVYGATRPATPPPPPAVIYVPPTLPPPPLGYHYEQLLDGVCNCYRWVLVQG